jgi:transposase
VGCLQTTGSEIQKKSVRATEQDRPDVVQARFIWQETAEFVDAERLVFLDETGLTTDMMRLRGWAFEGQRVVDATPGGHWQTNTLVSAIHADGIVAAMILDGPLNGESFEGFCRDCLGPALRPGQIVVLDNLSSHKSAAAEQWIRQAGASVAFLPPYSPDLNPIENIFSKIKQLVRGLRPRSWKQIISAAKTTLLEVTANDCINAIQHCGYEFY